MSRFGTEVSGLERHTSLFTLEALEPLLPSRMVRQVLLASGRASRRCRDLPAEMVVWLMVASGLWRCLGLRNVLAQMGQGACTGLGWMAHGKPGTPPTSAAICRARRRLGLRPMARLLRQMTSAWWQRCQERLRWHGMAVIALDGTTLRMPDTPQNVAHFGLHRVGRKRPCAFPFTRVLVAMCARTRVVLARTVGVGRSSDLGLVARILRQLPLHSLLLLDRGFFSYALFFDILARGHQVVARARGKFTILHRRRLGHRDYLVQIQVSRARRRHRPDLPAFLELRMVSYKRPGFERVTLFTSLLDATRYPAAQIMDLYRQRWEVELGFDEIKTHQLAVRVPVRSKSPLLVLQEIDGLLLAYNAVRMYMAEAAQIRRIDPRRLSFTDALVRVRDITRRMAQAAGPRLPSLLRTFLRDLATCILPPRRPRRYPRKIKHIPSRYPIRGASDAA